MGTFATGSAAHLGGFPGPSCIWENHLVYAEGGYVVGTDQPVIRIFDGRFDREVLRLPKNADGSVPKCVVTMLTANGTVYLTTYDSGTTSADWAGHIYALTIESAQLTPIGAQFTTGQLPYALAWHLGRLWCGTNRQSSAASGKVSFFRPGVDTAWTDDHTLSTDSQAGVASMLSYKGKLYVGCTAAAATFAKVLVRSELGVYTTSDTGTGGAAAANNGYIALAEFEDNLYASFFNPDTPNISKIRKFNNSSWSTAYTGAGTTLRPYVGFPQDSGFLLAIGGGAGYSASLVSTEDGTTWSDRTAFIGQGDTPSTGLPVFGTVLR